MVEPIKVNAPPIRTSLEILATPLTSKAVSKSEVLIPTRSVVESTRRVEPPTEKLPLIAPEPLTESKRETVTVSDSRVAGLRMVVPAEPPPV